MFDHLPADAADWQLRPGLALAQQHAPTFLSRHVAVPGDLILADVLLDNLGEDARAPNVALRDLSLERLLLVEQALLPRLIERDDTDAAEAAAVRLRAAGVVPNDIGPSPARADQDMESLHAPVPDQVLLPLARQQLCFFLGEVLAIALLVALGCIRYPT